ncbi:MAG: tRNA pseudouridine(38-40) synthase TruA [Bacteroidales bacterium]|nr:tRNA pseudouridine(38-40) synthase TruA [Bacteroidales bacterium]
MARFKLTIEYDGSAYHGWQLLKDCNSVQGKMMDSVKDVFGPNTRFELYGAGRTDAGVHALGQVAHLDIDTQMSPTQLKYRLNDALPATISIIDIKQVPKNFHARYDATSRSYIYQISTRKSAFAKRYAYWVKDKLDTKAMQEAANVMVGMKDFRSFGDKDSETKSTIVEVTAVNVYDDGGSIVVNVVGSHFLWKMVRRIVGTLIEVGRGRIDKRRVESYFNKFSPEPATFTVPPAGLYLEKVEYGGQAEDDEIPPIPLMYIR